MAMHSSELNGSGYDRPAWIEAAGSPRGRQFSDQIHLLLGADFEPDPSFLKECWIIGLPAAAENWYRRRQSQAEQERQRCALRELDDLSVLTVLETCDLFAIYSDSVPHCDAELVATAA